MFFLFFCFSRTAFGKVISGMGAADGIVTRLWDRKDNPEERLGIRVKIAGK